MLAINSCTSFSKRFLGLLKRLLLVEKWRLNWMIRERYSVVMEWYVEKYNKKIYDIYPEYATIPKMIEEQEVDQDRRPVRKRPQKKIN
jgi:hypothetical protein